MKIVLLIFVLLISFSTLSQTKEFNFRSISASIGGFQPYSGPNNSANFYVSIDGIFAKKKNLFGISFNRGFDFEISGIAKGNRYNFEFDVLYGREMTINKWLKFELYTGLGFFQGSYYKHDSESWMYTWPNPKLNDNFNNVRLGSLSLPIKSRLLFYTSKKISFGFSINASVNKISNLVSYSVIFQKKL